MTSPEADPTPTSDGDPRARAAVLARVQALVDFWAITADELHSHVAPPAPPPPIKYRHPKTGDTWDGQGEHPDWLRRALLQEGWRVDELKP